MEQVKTLPKHLKENILTAQQNEITEYYIYLKLAAQQNNVHNAEILRQIAEDEKAHAKFWQQYTGVNVKPIKWKILKYYWLAKVFGLTFGIKLMEQGESNAQVSYNEIATELPEAKKIAEDEDSHEKALIELIKEDKLKYIGSIVLGLNDALVELTGALAGLSLALQNTRLVAVAGLITGIAASLSMAASEYLSTKSEVVTEDSPNPVRSSIYTGIAYVVTVVLLIMPYFIFANYFVCLAFTITIALTIIFVFNYYISVAKGLNFISRFLEMAGLSLGVAALTFGIGLVIRKFIGIDI
ncbi:MAG: rubrerythrin family protein [Bacteroidales bacterium]|nr:rubrerythrin family protein [Bacteroidales bacterium]